MNKKIKKAWVKALRTGEINGKPIVQTDGMLRKVGKVVVEEGPHKGKKAAQLCCLGVLCELAVAEGVIPKAEKYDLDAEMFAYGGATAELPRTVYEWAGIKDVKGYPYDPTVMAKFDLPGGTQKRDLTLATLNDNHKFTFKQIAKAIEKNL